MKTKIILFYQNLADVEKMKGGAAEAIRLFNIATGNELLLEIDFKEVSNVFNTITYPNVTCVKPEEITPLARAMEIVNKKEYNIAALVFNVDKVVGPKVTNPVQNGVFYEGFTVIQVPENWYTDTTKTPPIVYPEVFTQFFLHEICHALYFLANVKVEPDMVDHTHDTFGDKGFKSPTDYYMSLITSLEPYYKFVSDAGTTASPTTPTTPTPIPTDGQLTHTVVSGETLSKIAAKYGMTLSALLSLNPKYVKNPNAVQIGDKITVIKSVATTPSVPTTPPALTGALTDAILLALADHGIKGLADGDNPKIVQYFADTGNSWVKDDETAWCAAFVGSCLERAKIGSTKSLAARSYLNWGKETKTPKLGDIVVFERPEAGPAAGHVAFFVRVEGQNVVVLGGNQSNAVGVASYPLARVLSYRTK